MTESCVEVKTEGGAPASVPTIVGNTAISVSPDEDINSPVVTVEEYLSYLIRESERL